MKFIGSQDGEESLVTKEVADQKADVVELSGLESSTTATLAYSVGQFLQYKDVQGTVHFAKVIADIDIGDTLVVHTNIEDTTLGAELLYLNKKTVTLTKNEYDRLTTAQKMDPDKFYYITDLYVTSVDIDDSSTGANKTWSSNKISSELANKQASLTFDNTPTANSTNPVKSGGIKTSIDTSQLAVTSLIEDTVGWSGKNLFPFTLDFLKFYNSSGTWNDNVYTLNTVTFTVQTDSNGYVEDIIVNGTPTAQTSLIVNPSETSTTHTVKFSNGDYIISGCPEGGSDNGFKLFVVEHYIDSTPSVIINETGSGCRLTWSNNTKDIAFTVYLTSGVVVSNKHFKPMVRKADIFDDTFDTYHKSVKDILYLKSDDCWLETTTTVNSSGEFTFSGLDDTKGWSYHPHVYADSNSTEINPTCEIKSFSGSGTSNLSVTYTTTADVGSTVVMRVVK